VRRRAAARMVWSQHWTTHHPRLPGPTAVPARRAHLTGSTKLGPLSFSSTGAINFTLLGLYDSAEKGAPMMSVKLRSGVLLASLLLLGCSADEDAPPSPPPPSVVTVTATPSPTSSSTVQPSASPHKRAHNQAKFTDFMVTVDDLQRRNSSEVRLLAKVCVRSLPPDPQGDRTRISWDPWQVRSQGRMIDADPAHATFKGAFPPDHTYRVGQCAEGWIPFLARGSVTKIKYANGVGDIAVWDAQHLDRKPEIRAKSPKPQKRSTPKRSTPPDAGTVTPGSFCSLPGTTGHTSAGTPMVCTSKGPGARLRWRER